MHVRAATAADLPDIRRLFNTLIPTTTVAWRDHPADPGEMRVWFGDQQAAGHPVLVAEVDGVVTGYTCWSTFRGGERFPGYRHTAELTIHVDSAHHGLGIGRALLSGLIDEGRRHGIHALVAGIDGDNTASVAFHRAMGFREVGRLPEVGRKFDRWLDLVLMQRIVA